MNRMETCRQQISKAKHDFLFWNKELQYVTDELAKDKQFNFDEFMLKSSAKELKKFSGKWTGESK